MKENVNYKAVKENLFREYSKDKWAWRELYFTSLEKSILDTRTEINFLTSPNNDLKQLITISEGLSLLSFIVLEQLNNDFVPNEENIETLQCGLLEEINPFEKYATCIEIRRTWIKDAILRNDSTSVLYISINEIYLMSQAFIKFLKNEKQQN